jgi:hypothetical protein
MYHAISAWTMSLSFDELSKLGKDNIDGMDDMNEIALFKQMIKWNEEIQSENNADPSQKLALDPSSQAIKTTKAIFMAQVVKKQQESFLPPFSSKTEPSGTIASLPPEVTHKILDTYFTLERNTYREELRKSIENPSH